jgi:hypothetical protein
MCDPVRINARHSPYQAAGSSQQSHPARQSWAPDHTPPSEACIHSDSDGSWDISSYPAMGRWTPESQDMSSLSMLSSRRGSHSSRSLIGATEQEQIDWSDMRLPQVDPWNTCFELGYMSSYQPQVTDASYASALVSESFLAPLEQAAQFPEGEPTVSPIATNTKRVGKRKGPLSAGGREKAKRVRRVKPCIRCKMYKEGVSMIPLIL